MKAHQDPDSKKSITLMKELCASSRALELAEKALDPASDSGAHVFNDYVQKKWPSIRKAAITDGLLIETARIDGTNRNDINYREELLKKLESIWSSNYQDWGDVKDLIEKRFVTGADNGNNPIYDPFALDNHSGQTADEKSVDFLEFMVVLAYYVDLENKKNNTKVDLSVVFHSSVNPSWRVGDGMPSPSGFIVNVLAAYSYAVAKSDNFTVSNQMQNEVKGEVNEEVKEEVKEEAKTDRASQRFFTKRTEDPVEEILRNYISYLETEWRKAGYSDTMRDYVKIRKERNLVCYAPLLFVGEKDKLAQKYCVFSILLRNHQSGKDINSTIDSYEGFPEIIKMHRNDSAFSQAWRALLKCFCIDTKPESEKVIQKISNLKGH